MTLLLQTKDVWTKLNKTRFVVFGWTVGCTTLLLGTWMAGCKASVPTADTKIFDLNRLSKAWKKHKDAWRKTVNKDSAPPPVVYLQRDYRLSYDKKGRAHWTIHKVFQPLTKQGVDSTDMIHAYWSPWYEKQPQIEARVRGPKGRRYRLDPKVVEIGSAAARHKILSSRRRLRAPLPGMTPGAIVDLTVRASQHRLVSQGGDVQSIWLTPTVPTLATRITITAPPHLYLKHAIKGLDLKPASDTLQNGRRRVVYRIGPRYKHLINQPHLPPQTLAVPQLVVSTARSWAHAARSARKRLENKIQPAAVQKIVQKLIGGRKLTTRKLVALFSRYIHQKVRYTSVSLGAGAVEPASPQKTLKRTFGDCKDMAVLLTSMLRAAGRKAYPAYIRAGTGLDVWPDMPGVAAFNHVIVWVDGKHPFWTDPTARWTVTDRLPLGCRGRQALVLKPAVRSLIRTPPLKAAENSYIEKRHFTLSERGGGRIVEISRSLSPLFARLRRDAAMRDPTAYKKHMKQYLKNHYAVESVTNIEHSKPTDLDKPFTIKLAGVGTKLALTDNTHAVARLSYLPLLHYLPNYLKRVPKKDSKRWKRKHDLWLRQPYSAHVRYTVDPPVAYALEKHPEQKTINLGPARLTWKTRVDEKTSCVDVDFHFTIRKQRYTARQVKQFWRSLKVLRLEHPELRVVYRHRAKQLIEAGKVRKALDLHRTLIQKYPRRAIHRSRLVEDLVFLGFVRDALKHARRNVRLFPKDIDALHTLAWTLEYNDFGQRWGKGYRRKQAIEAYEKAIAVDPKYVGARADFAKLLLKDENGLPNHDPKAIDAAISHMVVLRNQHNQKKFNTRLLHALLHRKRYTALHRHAKNMKPTAKILGLRVAAVVLAQGLQVGVRLARSWSKNQQTLRTVMLNAFLVLIKHRHYRVAYNLMRPMTEKLGNLQKFEIWSKVKRHAPPQRPPKTVREFLEQFAYRLYSGRWNKQRLNRTLPQSVTPAVRDRFNNMFTSIKHYLERGLKNDVIPLAVLTDMILSTTQIHFEGDRQSGWLARLSISLDSDSTITFYLIQTKEGIRLRSCSDMHAENGYLAHTYLVRGQLQSAERLLDWMAKNVNSASDPFKGTPFSHIWTSSVRRDIRTMQLAAAALIAEERPRARLAVRLLRKLKRKIRLPHHRLQLTRALANAYNKLDHHKKALKLYRKLHAMAPRAENPFYNLGLCLTELRQYKKVERLARKRFKNHPHDPWAYLLLMQRCLHKKQPKEIIELADKWIANAASSKHSNALRPWAHIMRAIAYVQMGKKHYKKALVDAVKANELSEASNRLILMKTALILVQLGKLRRAFALFMKLLEKRSIELPSSDEHYLRAKIAWAAGLKETAIRSLKRIKPHDLGEKTLYYKDAEKMLKRITKRPQSENPS